MKKQRRALDLLIGAGFSLFLQFLWTSHSPCAIPTTTTTGSSSSPKEDVKIDLIRQPTPSYYWSVEKTNTSQVAAWHWHDSSSSNATSIRIPNQPPYLTRPLKDALANAPKNTTIVFYGSSHTRELYGSLVRLARGQKHDAELEHAVKYVPMGLDGSNPKCGPKNSMFTTYRYGVDIANCGAPGKRLVPELASTNATTNGEPVNVAIGFKTYLHTPDADDLFVDFLTQHNLRHPTVLILDVGMWGPRGRRLGTNRTNTVWTPKQELEYYLNWIETTFPYSKLIFQYETPVIMKSLGPAILEGQSKICARRNLHRYPKEDQAVILRKDIILASKPDDMPCEHGCVGPLTMVVGILMMEWIQQVLVQQPQGQQQLLASHHVGRHTNPEEALGEAPRSFFEQVIQNTRD